MKPIILYVILSLFIFPNILSAGTFTSKITRIAAASSQYGIVVTEVPASSMPSCGQGSTILSFDKSTSHGKDMYSMMLTALVSQKNVIFTYSDANCGLAGIRILVTRMDMLR